MTKSNSKILPIMAIVGALFLFTKNKVQQFADSITITGVKYRNLKINFRNITFDLVFDVLNPTSFPLQFERIVGTVLYNGNNSLGSIDTSFGQINIPAGQIQQVTAQVQVPLLQVLGSVLSQIQNGFELPDSRIQGSVISSGISIPFNKSILKVG